MYGKVGTGGLVGLSNIDVVDATVTWQGQQWVLPAWSVTLLDAASLDVLYRTNYINATARLVPTHAMQPMSVLSSAVVSAATHDAVEQQHVSKARATVNVASLQHFAEPIGLSLPTVYTTAKPREQFNVTHDRTDYLWYVTDVNITADELHTAVYINLTLTTVNEFVYVFFNGQPKLLAFDTNVDRRTYHIPTAVLRVGMNVLQLLVVTMGMQNCCGGLEGFTRGLEGGVSVNGRDLTNGRWQQQPYLAGENTTITWQTGGGALFRPLTWYQFTIASPQPAASALPSWQLDMAAMGKGFVWFNDHPLGRYWDIVATQSSCEPCDYRGSYGPDKCRYDCNEPSLRLYHVPRQWLAPVGQDNMIVVLEERGGDPAGIALLQRN